MTLICLPVVGPSLKEVERQFFRALPLADVIELRLDLWERIEFDHLTELSRRACKPLLFTLRSAAHGGECRRSLEERLSLAKELLHLKPDYIDVEMSLGDVPDGVKVIYSEHHLEPKDDLETIWSKVLEHQADVHKVVVPARSSLDALRMVRYSQGIGICMEQDGQASRVLAATKGAPLMFASLEEGLGSASGQLPIDELVGQYRFRSLSKETQLTGLIGDPVALSRGPRIHNGVYDEHGIDSVYLPLRLPASDLPGFFEEVLHHPFRGLSVTMPLKEKVVPFLDELTEDARAIGAVNTLIFEGDKIVGDNVDGWGALEAIEQVEPIAGKRVAIVGAGGAARAIAFETLKRGGEVTLYNRTLARAEKVAHDLGCRAAPLESLTQDYDVLVQATSVGMIPNQHETIVPASLIRPGALVMDAVGKPEITRLLLEAQERDCRIVTGQAMFLYQAIRQQLLWFPEHNQRALSNTMAKLCNIGVAHAV